MSIIHRRIQVKHLVRWSIENFDFRIGYNRPIHSPPFDFRTLDLTTFIITLYPVPRTDSAYMQFSTTLQYNETGNSSAFFVASVRFSVCLLDVSGNGYFTTTGTFSPSFSSPTSTLFNFIPLNAFSKQEHLQLESTLVLSCALTALVNQRDFLASIFSDDLLSFGSCLVGLLETASRSDFVVHSKDGVPFNVHLFVLRARCPILFTEKSPDTVDFSLQPKPVWFSQLSTKALQTLLYYLYGRTVIEIVDLSIKEELFAVAGRYGLFDLDRKLRKYPIEHRLKTEVLVEKMAFKHPLGDAIWEKGLDMHHQIRFSTKMIVPDLVMSLEVKTSKMSQTANMKYLNANFKFASPVREGCVYMYCKFSLLDDESELISEKEYLQLVVGDEWTPWPPFYTTESHRELRPKCIKCELRISEAYLDHHPFLFESELEQGPLVLFNDLSLIGIDLKKLYEDKVLCDLKIEVGDREFFGHTSFLANRSLTIRQKLEKCESDAIEVSSGMVTIRLDGIRPQVCEAVFLYMYFGKIIVNAEGAKEMSEAARYFQLSNLYEKCSSMMTGKDSSSLIPTLAETPRFLTT